ncbi:MAG: glycosyltransferase [Vallitalea sp.]|jgi:glycosyltransferase involved in cell wall biosynthesis|nr:glycosyltransferase [Vallitalea sp.]
MTISIIIDVNEEELNNQLKILDSILTNYQSELILIHHNKDSIFNIPYQYSVIEYNSSYSNYNDFCIASSLGDWILIIEKNIKITTELINQVRQVIDNNHYYYLSINKKIYLSTDKSSSYTTKEIILYRRQSNHINCSDITIEDYSLIQLEKDNIPRNIEKLIFQKAYNQLFLWYKKCILHLSKDLQLYFLTTLEIYKNTLNKSELVKLENQFINENISNHYVDYLKLRKLYELNKEKFYTRLNKIYQDIFNEKDIYICWLLKIYFQNNKIPTFLINLSSKLQKKYLYYILDKDKDSLEYIYNIIMNNTTQLDSCDSSKELTSYLCITKYYIDYLCNISYSIDNKEKILNSFELYIYNSNLYINNYSDSENIYIDSEFINLINNIEKLISQDNIADAISMLNNICTLYPLEEKLIHYYIHELQQDKNFYPYKLSICMIVKNEEKNIERCLKSLKPIIDYKIAELIIVDTGSTDETIHLAKKYVNNIYKYKWSGNFADARNYSILFASGEYVLIIDADEEFAKTDAEELIHHFSNKEHKQYNTFTINIISYTDIELSKYSTSTQRRIFRNHNFYYKCAIHNQPMISHPIANLNINLLHYGYIMNDHIRDIKFNRTGSMLMKELEKDPYNLYYRYQLCASYSMYGDIINAVRQVDIYMRIIEENNKLLQDTNMTYYNLATSLYIEVGRFKDAEKIIDDALKLKPNYIDFIYYKAYTLFNKKNYEDTLQYIEKFLKTLDVFSSLDISTDSRYVFNTLSYRDKALRLSILAYYRLSKYDKCIKIGNDIKEHIILKDCLHEIVNSYFNLDKSIELAKFYNNKIISSNNTIIEKVFMYFLLDNLFTSNDKERKKYLSSILQETKDDKLINTITDILITQNKHSEFDTLDLIDIYDIDEMDFNSAYSILSNALPLLLRTENNLEILQLKKLKRLSQLILHRTKTIEQSNTLEVIELLNIFKKYMLLTTNLINNNMNDFLENRERIFIANISVAFNKNINNMNYAMNYMKNALTVYHKMNGIIELVYNYIMIKYFKAKD